jgi:hypothetical protein
MFLMCADPLGGQVGGGWALEIESFLGPVKRHRADRRMPFGAQKLIRIRFRIYTKMSRIPSTTDKNSRTQLLDFIYS